MSLNSRFGDAAHVGIEEQPNSQGASVNDTYGSALTSEGAGVSEPLENVYAKKPERFPGPRWSLAFVGLLGYLIFQYLMVPAQFPFLRPLALGKVTLILGALGLVFETRSRARPGISLRVIQLMLLLVVVVGFVSTCLADYQEEGWRSFSDLLIWSGTAFLIGLIATSSWRQRICIFVVLILNLKMAQSVIRNYSAFRASGSSAEDLATKGVGAYSVGFFANSGDFGAAMCVVWGLAAMLLVGEPRKSLRIFLLVCLAAFTVAIIASGSRAAFLAVCAEGLVIWLRKPSLKRIGAMVIVFFMLPAFYYMLPQANKDRLLSLRDPERDKTARIRIDLWRAGVNMFRDHPVIGVGPGNFNPMYDHRYAGPDRNPIVSAPHSIYVQNFAELGVLGFVPLVILWITFFLMNRKTRIFLAERGHKEGKSFEMAMTRGLDLAMIGYFITGAFATLFYVPQMWILLGFAIGLHIAASRRPPDSAYSELDSRDAGPELAVR